MDELYRTWMKRLQLFLARPERTSQGAWRKPA